MAVAVARRHGLHVALTRFAAAGRPEPGYAACAAACWPSRTPCSPRASQGPVTGPPWTRWPPRTRRPGAPDGWREHYQGGPIGFAQREFEIAPGQRESRWYREPVAAGHALAWNPSLPGGAKAEDTFLVTGGEARRITSAPGWPAEISDRGTEIPAVLEVGP